MNGNLNYWDYLEVTTGFDRGKCKRIVLTLGGCCEGDVYMVSEVLGYPRYEVQQVKDYWRKWQNWIERRKG